MRGQSVGIFPISSGGPAPIIAELEKIVDSGENGLRQNVIKFQPVTSLNAILVLSNMFMGGSSSGLLDSADNQIAPGSGISFLTIRHPLRLTLFPYTTLFRP